MSGLPMLFRFSLYGFLKNQQYYEPFFILALQEKGLTFLQIGLLVGFREVCINLMSIPTGVIADLYGRRKSMVFSFLAYIVSFLIFGFATGVSLLVLAMFFFAIGESFRSGTHKSMIFEWLRAQGRMNERTKIYGFTRSWSKIGSALSVIIGVVLVFRSGGSYNSIFFMSIIPFVLNIFNCLTYPKELDPDIQKNVSVRQMLSFLWTSFQFVKKSTAMKRIFSESMGFEMTHDLGMNYLQPILKQAAIALPLFLSMAGYQRTAILIGIVNVCLHLVSSVASRKAHVLADRVGGEENAARVLWYLNLGCFIGLTVLLIAKLYVVASICFICLSILQNFWRPALMSRIDDNSSSEMGTTILSIESQLKSMCVMIGAPIMGYIVDHEGFWPLGVFGVMVAMGMLMTGKGMVRNLSKDLQPTVESLSPESKSK
jgi:MFS family permease